MGPLILYQVGPWLGPKLVDVQLLMVMQHHTNYGASTPSRFRKNYKNKKFPPFGTPQIAPCGPLVGIKKVECTTTRGHMATYHI